MQDTGAIRQRLEAAIEKGRRKVARYESLTEPIAPDNAIGRVSRMDAINNKAVSEAALRKAREQLAGLQEHLQTLDTPDFGLCRKCQKPIPIERILLAPESRFCVTCAR
ncbi:MAG: TraR/DksA C4-type zinc finger protein [Robiginitalea sp.]|jgi:DnaK suppressor protein